MLQVKTSSLKTKKEKKMARADTIERKFLRSSKEMELPCPSCGKLFFPTKRMPSGFYKGGCTFFDMLPCDGCGKYLEISIEIYVGEDGYAICTTIAEWKKPAS